MKIEPKFPIELKMKLDLNSDLQLTELQNLLNKNRSQVVRLIIQDFFNRNAELLDEHITNKIKIDPLVLFRDLHNISKPELNKLLNNGK